MSHPEVNMKSPSEGKVQCFSGRNTRFSLRALRPERGWETKGWFRGRFCGPTSQVERRESTIFIREARTAGNTPPTNPITREKDSPL